MKLNWIRVSISYISHSDSAHSLSLSLSHTHSLCSSALELNWLTVVKSDSSKQVLPQDDTQDLQSTPHCAQSKWMSPICYNGMVEKCISNLEMGKIITSWETSVKWMLTSERDYDDRLWRKAPETTPLLGVCLHLRSEMVCAQWAPNDIRMGAPSR